MRLLLLLTLVLPVLRAWLSSKGITPRSMLPTSELALPPLVPSCSYLSPAPPLAASHSVLTMLDSMCFLVQCKVMICWCCYFPGD